MMTLRQFSLKPETISTATSWYIADLSEARGKQELFTKQAPQRLKVLRENAIIESTVSSNRIEGVSIPQSRVRPLILGQSRSLDRNEEEVRGYRDALKLIHEQGSKISVSEETIRRLHRLCRGDIGDAGRYRDKESEIIEKSPDGRERIRFQTAQAARVPVFMRDLIDLWHRCLEERWVHPLVALAAFNLDFLCVHPFRDGNGRVSRLLLLLQCYHLGYDVGRYISLERLIEQNKGRYYETLELSSEGWHEGRHNPWPYVDFVLYTLKTAYREFEERVGRVKAPRGTKTELVERAVSLFSGPFALADLERSSPGVSRDMIRKILRRLQKQDRVECLGRGPGAPWKKKGNTLKRG
jgi:Fic family protein